LVKICDGLSHCLLVEVMEFLSGHPVPVTAEYELFVAWGRASGKIALLLLKNSHLTSYCIYEKSHLQAIEYGITLC